MPYYLAEVEPGRQLRPGRISKRPVGIESPARRNWIYIGPGRSQALLWASDAIADKRLVKIADDGREKLAQATRDAFLNVAKDGRQFRSTDDFDATIAQLLLQPPDGQWAALKPSKSRKRYEVLLGPDKLLWTQVAAPTKNTKTYVDTFDRSNSSTLGTSSDGLFSWTEEFGTTFAITSNQLTATNIPGGGDGLAARTSADCDTDDIYAQIERTTFTRNSGYLDSFIGIAGNAAHTNGYGFRAGQGADAARSLVAWSDFSTLDEDSTFTATGTFRIERDGSTIRGLLNGVEILSATDTGEASGAGNRRAFVTVYSEGNNTNDVAFNNFGYGDLSTTPDPATLTVADAAHGHAADAPTLSQANTLAVADALHGHAADNLVLVQSFVLSVAEALHAHAAEAPALTQANTLAVAGADHAHTAESPVLAQAHVLAIAEALHGHSVDSPSLSQANTLAVAEAAHAHAVDGVMLSTENTLGIADSTHGHSVDSLSLTQAHILAIQDALHAHGVDNVELSFGAILAVSETLHGHSADGVALAQAHVLAVQEASHGHAVDTISLSQGMTLTIADGLHLHAVDAVVLTQGHILAIQEALHAHLADSVGLTQAGTLTVQDALHAHLVDAVVLALPGLRPKNIVLVPARNRSVQVAGRPRTVTVH